MVPGTSRTTKCAMGVRAGQPYRRIASQELFTSLVCIILLVEERDVETGLQLRLTSETDNLGNAHAVSKLMTTRFPLVAFLAKPAVQAYRRRAHLQVHWVPRQQNIDSDELSNNLVRRFDPATEVKVEMDKLNFEILQSLLDFGEPMYENIGKEKQARKEAGAPVQAKGRKRPLEEKLRHTDPW